MKKAIILISLVSLSLFSCDKLSTMFEKKARPLQQEANVDYSYYANGDLLSEIHFDSARRYHGMVKKYYKGGKVKSEITFDHGIKTMAKQYFENGQLEMLFNYKEGRKHGQRLKYWEHGQLQSELYYFNGEPQKGLIEYDKAGKKVTKYPDLVVKQKDELYTNGTYKLEAYFSSNPQKGTYFKGELVNGTIPRFAEKFKKVKKHGIYTYKPRPGQFIMEKVNVIGRYRTAYNNIYIVEKTVNVAIDY